MESEKEIIARGSLKQLAAALSKAGMLIEASITDDMLKEVDPSALAYELIEGKSSEETLHIVKREELQKAIDRIMEQKQPIKIEVNRSSDYKPLAAEIDAQYKIMTREAEHTNGTVNDFVLYFRDRLDRMRQIIGTHNSNGQFLQNLAHINDYASGREVYIMGIVSRKIITKNNNIMIELEDEEDYAKVIFMNGSSKEAQELYTNANSITNDEVLAIKGKISGPFVIASMIVWPDVQIKQQKKLEQDINIAFLSDIHVGSKLFMEKNFSKMIRWLNGDADHSQMELVGGIKYLVISGDDADGIGVYPNQDKDLAVSDMYTQYKMLFDFIDAIPDYIQIFIMPGNHDAVQRAEPQPPLPQELIGDFKKDNVHIVSNPTYMSLHGLDVLGYHGTSLDSIISAIPNNSYAVPEKAMVELLKRRHLSPIYGGNIIVPSKKDNLVMDVVPDILHMGHIHKNGTAKYHGVTVINSGTWQGRTDFQVRQGHIPTPCIMPVFKSKDYTVTSIDFNR
ncbi:MAG: DNA-directed DNA polymerase II small subunit [Candidatus Marsarchaeota archaeon]|nr:DNA-directed DNA polymerase II small subunit [Candidatus Marsarchaeota archaeon]